MTGPIPGVNLLPIFMVGLLGSVHCVGMCGGIVSAFSMTPAARKFPVAVVVRAGPIAEAGTVDSLLRVIEYNAGRIASYATAGAIAGGIVGGVRTLASASVVQMIGYWLANLMLATLGLYLMDAWRGLSRIEAAGQTLWRRIQPLTKHLMPLDSPLKMLALGGLWGWLPCGMVYSVLLTAMLSGSALSGAAVMLIFGLGTLPVLLMMGMLGACLRSWLQRRSVRFISGLVVLGFGVLGLIRVADGIHSNWLDVVCVTPTPALSTGAHP
ncbi:sulfite exporter TauE/SafE family protein [Paraherbaspirillum soli]|uniref:Sulfite exporter TauE/SafE family protein n=1 Tax=Paraherbaspirillum soli TaxID=631222 RepID=A0ABW0M8F5_9BURK